MSAQPHQGAVRNWERASVLLLGGSNSTLSDDATAASNCMEFSGALTGAGIMLNMPGIAASVLSRCQGEITADLGGDKGQGKIAVTVERRMLIGPSGQPSVYSILRQTDDGTAVEPFRVTRSGVKLGPGRLGFRLLFVGDAIDSGDPHNERVTVDFVLDALPDWTWDGSAPTLTITGVVHRAADVLIERVGA